MLFDLKSRRGKVVVGLAGLLVLSLVAAVAVDVQPADAGVFKKKKGSDTDKKADGTSGDEKQAPVGTYAGPKKIIAVSNFKAGQSISYDSGEALSAMLSEAIMRTGRFIVVERTELADVLGEQDLGADGRTTSATAAKVGNLLGASILVMGTVTQFEEQASSGGGGISFRGVGGGGGKTKAYVKINLRLVDTATGRILSTHNADGTATGKSGSGSATIRGVHLRGSGAKKTPIGQAAQDAIDEAVEHIAQHMKSVPFTARVADVDGSDIYINAGSLRNMAPDMVLVGYKVKKEIKDPDTGLVLEAIMEKTGSVRIVSVREKISIATKIDGSIKKGQTLQMD